MGCGVVFWTVVPCPFPGLSGPAGELTPGGGSCHCRGLSLLQTENAAEVRSQDHGQPGPDQRSGFGCSDKPNGDPFSSFPSKGVGFSPASWSCESSEVWSHFNQGAAHIAPFSVASPHKVSGSLVGGQRAGTVLLNFPTVATKQEIHNKPQNRKHLKSCI